MKEFYQMTASEAMQKVNGGVEPLSEQQIREKQKRYGENRLTEEGKKPVMITGDHKITAAAIAMAFGTLCISRLLYGFHCKSEQAVLLQKGF